MNADLHSPESLVKALYQSISFEKGKSPNLHRLRNLFIDEGMLLHCEPHKYTAMTPDQFINSYQKKIDDKLFHKFIEFEIKKQTEAFGGILHVLSTYESEYETENGLHGRRGINSIQIININKEWKVVSIIWFDESNEYPIPHKYL